MQPETSLLGRLGRWLAANRPDYYARLQPGATEEALAAFEARFALELPPTFRALYQWRNGQDPAYFASFQDHRMFSSLEAITATKDVLDDMIGYDFADPRWWRRGWVPFLANGGGAQYYVSYAYEPVSVCSAYYFAEDEGVWYCFTGE
jgi:cell wall assembly regulator SMI1